MWTSIKTGVSFGLTSGVITTLGLIVGLHSGTRSRLAVIGGILTIAIADAFSDALGIHISKETECRYDAKEIWVATLATFLSKLIFASTFIFPFLFLSLYHAIIVGIAWGFFILALLSYFIARSKGAAPWKVISEHIIIGLVVIVIAHWTGIWISNHF